MTSRPADPLPAASRPGPPPAPSAGRSAGGAVRPRTFLRGLKALRILPLATLAVGGLLFLKVTGLILNGGYLFPPGAEKSAKTGTEADLPRFARVLARARYQRLGVDPETTGTVPEKKKEEGAVDEAKLADEIRKAAEGRQSPQSRSPTPPSPAERQVLERLRERHQTLDGQEKDLEMRENLIKAAEKKLEGRIGELQHVESKVFDGARAKEQEDKNQLKTLVVMYEAMKPKDAAKVFDRLDLRVLVPVVTQMNPRKMSEILAVMTPESAEKLTVALVNRSGSAESGREQPLPPGELPRIDGAAPRR